MTDSTGNRPRADARRAHNLSRGGVISLLALVSGVCGLSYEVLYTRLLSNVFGGLFFVGAGVFTSFLLGIGIGSLVAYRMRRWLFAFEFGLGVYALLFLPVYDHWLQTPPAPGSTAAQLALIVALLFPAAFQIGCSVPLFSEWLDSARSGNSFQTIYLLYNLGAAASVILLEYWLIWNLGTRYTLLAISGVNGVLGTALFFVRDTVSAAIRPRPWNSALLQPVLGGLFAVSVASGCYQLIVIKILQLVLGPFRDNFALAVTCGILGIAAGTAIVGKLRIRFAWWVIGGTCLLLATPALFTQIVTVYSLAFKSLGPGVWSSFAAKVIFCAIAVFPISIFFGGTIAAVTQNCGDVARGSGLLLACSAFGNTCGYLLMAFVLYPFVPLARIYVVIAGLCMYVVLFCGNRREIRLGLGAFTVLLPAAVLMFHDDLLYSSYLTFRSPASIESLIDHPPRLDKTKRHLDDVAIIVSRGISDDGEETTLHRFALNGYVSMHLESLPERLVGLFPACHARRRDSVLVVGLGSGITAGSAAQLFKSVDVVEINEAVISKVDELADFNLAVAKMPNTRILLDDGMNMLDRGRKYDVIISTTTSPRYFSSSKIYTSEFFQRAVASLSPGGVFATWFDARMGTDGAHLLLRTMARHFRHSSLWILKRGYYLLCCSNDPIAMRAHPHEIATAALAAEIEKYGIGATLEELDLQWLDVDFLQLARMTDTGRELPVNSIDLPALERRMSLLNDTTTDFERFNSELARLAIVRAYVARSSRLSPAVVLDFWCSQFDPTHPFSAALRRVFEAETTDLAGAVEAAERVRIARKLNQMLASRPDDAALWWHRIGLHHWQNWDSPHERGLAETALRNAIRLKPNEINCRRSLVNLLLQLGREKEAADELDDAMRIEPDLASFAYQLRGRLQSRAGAAEEAAGSYARSFAALPLEMKDRLSRHWPTAWERFDALTPLIFIDNMSVEPLLMSEHPLARAMLDDVAVWIRQGLEPREIREHLIESYGTVLETVPLAVEQSPLQDNKSHQRDLNRSIAGLWSPLPTCRKNLELLEECTHPYAHQIRTAASRLLRQGLSPDDVRSRLVAMFGTRLATAPAEMELIGHVARDRRDVPAPQTASGD